MSINNIFFSIFIYLLFLLGCGNKPHEIYVSYTGSPKNPGTLENPINDLNLAIDKAYELKSNEKGKEVIIILTIAKRQEPTGLLSSSKKLIWRLI